jgi:hypothetical protein
MAEPGKAGKHRNALESFIGRFDARKHACINSMQIHRLQALAISAFKIRYDDSGKRHRRVKSAFPLDFEAMLRTRDNVLHCNDLTVVTRCANLLQALAND